MAKAFGLTDVELDAKLSNCESKGGYHFWIVTCRELCGLMGTGFIADDIYTNN